MSKTSDRLVYKMLRDTILFNHPDDVIDECKRAALNKTDDKLKTIYEGITWILKTNRDTSIFLAFCFHGDLLTWLTLINYLYKHADNNINSIWHTTNEFFNREGRI